MPIDEQLISDLSTPLEKIDFLGEVVLMLGLDDNEFQHFSKYLTVLGEMIKDYVKVVESGHHKYWDTLLGLGEGEAPEQVGGHAGASVAGIENHRNKAKVA